MRILFAGTPAVAVPTLRQLVETGHDVVAVLTQPARARGRSSKLEPSAVALAAEEYSIPVLSPERVSQAASEIANLDLDLAVVVAYGQLLPESILELAQFGWVNLHFSLLPLWRGAAPVQRAIMAGDEITGASTFLIEAGMDTGPVFGNLSVQIGADETAGELLERLAQDGAELMVQTVSGIAAGHLLPVTQDHSLATHAPKVLPEDGLIKWAHPALAISRLIRGCTPEPGAWTLANGERLGISKVSLTSETQLTPGELAISKSEVLVGTGSSAIRLGEVRPAGRKWMSAADWARGLRQPIDRLGS